LIYWLKTIARSAIQRRAVGVERIGPEQNFNPIAETIPIRIRIEWIGPVHKQFLEIVQTIAVGVRVLGIGADQHFKPIRQSIAIAVGQRVDWRNGDGSSRIASPGSLN
jgi:hypothetical protein